MSLFRWIIGMPMAALVSAALFIMMALLIRQEVVGIETPRETPLISITTQEPIVGPDKTRTPKERIPENIPETTFEYERTTTSPTGQAFKPEYKPVETTPPGTDGFAGPTIRIAPPYPENCRSKGAQGVVVVQFDVTPEGNVVNPRVIQAPDSCFVRPIQKAVSGWKYAPAPGGGMRYGVVEKFNFQLTD